MTLLQTRPTNFDALFAEGISSWPAELRLPRRELDDGGYYVEGLTELEDSLSQPLVGTADRVLLLTLNWAILTAAHVAFAGAATVRPAELSHAVRPIFTRMLHEASADPAFGQWSSRDLALIHRYFEANAEAA